MVRKINHQNKNKEKKLLEKEEKKKAQEEKKEEVDLDSASLFDCRFFNSFEKPLFEKYPVLKEIKNDFLAFASDFSLMSGSGSSVYGLFRDWQKARVVQTLFSKKWSNCDFFIPIEK